MSVTKCSHGFTAKSYVIKESGEIVDFERGSLEHMQLCEKMGKALSDAINSTMTLEERIEYLKSRPENQKKDAAIRKMTEAVRAMQEYADEHPEFYDEMLKPYDD